MKPVTIDEIVGPDRYPALRATFREAIAAHKRRRRLAVGDEVTLLFEDHETLRYQIQEMVWVERIADPARIQDEIDVYNELMPGPRELSATLFIEITERARIRPQLDRLIGIDEHVSLRIGEGAIAARFDPKQMGEDRISAVHYVRLAFDEAQARRFADARDAVRVRIDHPAYRAEAALPEPVWRSLCETLADATPAVLPAARGAAPPPAGAALFEGARVRARRPEGGAGEIVVEARDPHASLLDADAELAREIFEALRRAAATLVAEQGACRIHAHVAPGEALRWHLRAVPRR